LRFDRGRFHHAETRRRRQLDHRGVLRVSPTRAGDLIEFLGDENRVLKAQLQGQRVRLSTTNVGVSPIIGQRFGCRLLAIVGTIVTPRTILQWHRELIARKCRFMQRERRSFKLNTFTRPTW
jgi:hypothetical protein